MVMPRADTHALQHHLDAIARTLAPKAHAVLVLDQAGWHTTEKLRLPQTLSLLPLPPKSPELNPHVPDEAGILRTLATIMVRRLWFSIEHLTDGQPER